MSSDIDNEMVISFLFFIQWRKEGKTENYEQYYLHNLKFAKYKVLKLKY